NHSRSYFRANLGEACRLGRFQGGTQVSHAELPSYGFRIRSLGIFLCDLLCNPGTLSRRVFAEQLKGSSAPTLVAVLNTFRGLASPIGCGRRKLRCCSAAFSLVRLYCRCGGGFGTGPSKQPSELRSRNEQITQIIFDVHAAHQCDPKERIIVPLSLGNPPVLALKCGGR